MRPTHNSTTLGVIATGKQQLIVTTWKIAKSVIYPDEILRGDLFIPPAIRFCSTVDSWQILLMFSYLRVAWMLSISRGTLHANIKLS